MEREDSRLKIERHLHHVVAARRFIRDGQRIREVENGLVETVKDRLQNRNVRLVGSVDIETQRRAGLAVEAWAPCRRERGVVELALVDPRVAALTLLDADQDALRDSVAAQRDSG